MEALKTLNLYSSKQQLIVGFSVGQAQHRLAIQIRLLVLRKMRVIFSNTQFIRCSMMGRMVNELSSFSEKLAILLVAQRERILELTGLV